MPIVESLMRALRRRYGNAKGDRVYHAMEATAKGPFSEGSKYHELHRDWARRHGVKPLRKETPPRHPARGRKRRG